MGWEVRVLWKEWNMRRGERLGRRGQLKKSLNRKKRLCQSRKRISREKTRPTTRVSRNQNKVVRAAPIRRYQPPYEDCTTHLPAPLNPPRRAAREADATLPRSRSLSCDFSRRQPVRDAVRGRPHPLQVH